MGRNNFCHDSISSTSEYSCSECENKRSVKSGEVQTQGWFDVNVDELTMICSLECLKLRQKKRKVKHKFNAKPCVSNGIKFSSKAERAFYEKLKMLQKVGQVLFFLRQVPFQLPGNTKYFVDFQVFYSNGDISFVDVKGLSTPLFVMKKKQVEDLYPIEILVVK